MEAALTVPLPVLAMLVGVTRMGDVQLRMRGCQKLRCCTGGLWLNNALPVRLQMTDHTQKP